MGEGTSGQYEKVLKMDYNVIQINGQRITECTKCSKCVMPKGSEIFIGKLPKDVYEDKLYDIFSTAGRIYKIRIMLDFTGLNRGYAFITYFTKQQADDAISMFNNYKIDWVKIAVHRSIDNCRLYVGGIPNTVTKDMVLEEISRIAEGVEDVLMYKSYEDKQLNRGYAFVEFTDHRTAAIARRKLCTGCLILWNVSIFVDWAQPEPDVDPEVMSQVTRLYLNNLEINLTTKTLRAFIENHIRPWYITRVHKILDYAFVHLTTRTAAENALAVLQGTSIYGRPIHAEWARPTTYNKINIARTPSDSFCTSLPFGRRRKHRKFEGELSDEACARSSTNSISSSSSSGSNPMKESVKTEYSEKMKYTPKRELSISYSRDSRWTPDSSTSS